MFQMKMEGRRNRSYVYILFFKLLFWEAGKTEMFSGQLSHSDTYPTCYITAA